MKKLWLSSESRLRAAEAFKTLFVSFSFLLLLFPSGAICQTSQELKLPKPDEIDRIEISNTSMVNWYKPEELLKLLPKLVPSEGSYLTKGAFQRGSFVLKNGKKITWMVGDKGSILLYAGGAEQLYVLSGKRILHDPAEPIFPVWDAEGKDGFIDINGNPVIEGFNAVGEFSEGLAPAMIGDKWGYIDRTGKVVIMPRWKNNDRAWEDPVGPFSDGLAAVIEYASWSVRDDSNYWTYNCGYIDKTGKYVIPPKMRQSCGNFSEGLAPVAIDLDGPEDTKSGGWIGYIDTKGNWAIAPKFYQGGNFSGGYAIAADASDEIDRNTGHVKTHLIDKKGERAAGVKDCRWRYRFSEGLALAFSDNEKRYDGYIDENCEYVFKFPADVQGEPGTSMFSQGLAAVYQQRPLLPGEISYSTYRKKTWGYIDKTGKVVIPLKFTSAMPFSEGYATVGKERDGDSYIDLKGDPAFTNALNGGSFKNGLAYQYLFTFTISEKPTSRNIRGYMNKQGKYVWLAPGAEIHLDKKWIKENYAGPQKF